LALGTLQRDLPEEVSWLQVRADRTGDIPLSRLRQNFDGKLLYSLGSATATGAPSRADEDRRRRLIAAASDGYDLVELDSERDSGAYVLDAIRPEQRLVSWRGAATAASDLLSRFHQLSSIAARSYLLVVETQQASGGLAPLSFLRSVNRTDVTAYADSEVALWSRVLTACTNAPFLFLGSLAGCRGPADAVSPSRMIADYGLPALRPIERICGIVGNSAAKSLSPRLHNAGYSALKYPAIFLPFCVNAFPDFWREFVESGALAEIDTPPWGFTVASPNKEDALSLATTCSRVAQKASSANLMYRRGSGWVAATSDPIGVFANIARRTITGRRAAVVGCGGSGRAIALALRRAGALVTLVNRCQSRGDHASRLLGLPFAPLSGFSIIGYDLVVNATPVGTDGESLPFELDPLERETIVVDLVYTSGVTPLVAEARRRGACVVDGRAVLLGNVEHQFFRMTGLRPTVGLMADMLGLEAATPEQTYMN
jgi:3-dehydroquinate dehydratase/shikimate dehydrogenase